MHLFISFSKSFSYLLNLTETIWVRIKSRKVRSKLRAERYAVPSAPGRGSGIPTAAVIRSSSRP